MITNDFIKRHLGPGEDEISEMLKKTGVSSLDELIDQTIPESIKLKRKLDLPPGMNEYEYLNHIRGLASKNRLHNSYIGQGYYNTITPGVILRNVLENPGWYTSYTPYQAEISQGRLEALLNFQTMISDLTGMPVANASLLDEGTAAAEAMIMFFNARTRDQVKNNVIKFFVSEDLFAQTLDVIKTRAVPLGIELVIGNHEKTDLSIGFFGAIVQYPDRFGEIKDYTNFVKDSKQHGVAVAVAADILSLTLLTPPGEWGADAVVGSTQRFGIPMGYGGPHAAYFATLENYKRHVPGRIIG
ncbi:MAG: glycine dehydrogenase (aminomethyl-transferring), partial [Bacteroidales bacterium]|nr:glycine dehydrogenase (aminomethyl-transferring) [Bacteroidales bacterium]